MKDGSRPNQAKAMKAYWRKQSKKARKENIQKAIYSSASKPRSAVQMRSIRKARKTCHNAKQRAAAIRSIRKAHKLPRTAKQIAAVKRSIKLAQAVNRKQRAWHKGLLRMQKLPRTKKQLAASKRNGKLMGPINVKYMRKRPSKVQIRFSLLLKKRIVGLKLDNYPIWADGHRYCPDVVNPKTRRCIEIDGEYWHSHHVKQDRIRDARLKRAGWKVLRLSADSSSLFKPPTLQKAVSFLNGSKCS